MKERLQNTSTWMTWHRTAIGFLILVAIAALSSGLTACGQPGSQGDAASVVERYLGALKANDFPAWKSTLWAAQKDAQAFTPSFEKPGDLGVLSLSIGKVAVSDEETGRIRKMYSGSDLAKGHGWSDEFIAENLIAVSAQYTVDYDNTRVPYPEGTLTQYFYLVRDAKDAAWLIWDSSSPSN